MPLDLGPEAIRRYALLAQMDGADAGQAPPAPSKGIGWGPYAALAGGEAADILSTLHAKAHGAHESNPILGDFGPGAIALKAGMAVPMAVLMRQLDKSGHDKLAKFLGYGSGAGLGAVAARNMMVGGREPQR